MYRKIEKIYKKQSPYNKIKIKLFFTYIIIVFFLLLFNAFNLSFLMMLTVIITIIKAKKICEKELGTKLNFNLNKKDTKGKFLNEIICEKENEMFQSYLKKNKMYCAPAIKSIMEHYRNLIKPKVVGNNILSVMTIIVSILLAFVTKEGFDLKSFENSMPYLICSILVILIIFVAIKQFSEIKTFLKGEEGMYERLETIFSELYIETLREKDDLNKKRRIKTKISKSKNMNIEKSKNATF